MPTRGLDILPCAALKTARSINGSWLPATMNPYRSYVPTYALFFSISEIAAVDQGLPERVLMPSSCNRCTIVLMPMGATSPPSCPVYHSNTRRTTCASWATGSSMPSALLLYPYGVRPSTLPLDASSINLGKPSRTRALGAEDSPVASDSSSTSTSPPADSASSGVSANIDKPLSSGSGASGSVHCASEPVRRISTKRRISVSTSSARCDASCSKTNAGCPAGGVSTESRLRNCRPSSCSRLALSSCCACCSGNPSCSIKLDAPPSTPNIATRLCPP